MEVVLLPAAALKRPRKSWVRWTPRMVLSGPASGQIQSPRRLQTGFQVGGVPGSGPSFLGEAGRSPRERSLHPRSGHHFPSSPGGASRMCGELRGSHGGRHRLYRLMMRRPETGRPQIHSPRSECTEAPEARMLRASVLRGPPKGPCETLRSGGLGQTAGAAPPGSVSVFRLRVGCNESARRRSGPSSSPAPPTDDSSATPEATSATLGSRRLGVARRSVGARGIDGGARAPDIWRAEHSEGSRRCGIACAHRHRRGRARRVPSRWLWASERCPAEHCLAPRA